MAEKSDFPQHHKSCNYLEPLIVPPAREHRQTLILLHGRGSRASIFGPEILTTEIPNLKSLANAFPHAQFLFPTAPRRLAAIFQRIATNQRFDNWSQKDPTVR